MAKSMPMKKFITLSCEAMEGLSKDDARTTFRSIKNNTNAVWTDFQQAEQALSAKMELNEEVEELEEDIEEHPNSTKYAVRLQSLLCRASTIKLIRDSEVAFNKEPSTFASITAQSRVDVDIALLSSIPSTISTLEKAPALASPHQTQKVSKKRISGSSQGSQASSRSQSKSKSHSHSKSKSHSSLRSIPKSKSKSKQRKHSKPLVASTTNDTTQDEDSDDDDDDDDEDDADVFNYQAYFKLREKNMGPATPPPKPKKQPSNSSDDEDDDDDANADEDDDEEEEQATQAITTEHPVITMKLSNKSKSGKSDQKEEVLTQESMDTYPVDEDANYTIIAEHFKNGITANNHVDHSVLDLDDLMSIRLASNDGSEYADSQMSMDSTDNKFASQLTKPNIAAMQPSTSAASSTSNESYAENVKPSSVMQIPPGGLTLQPKWSVDEWSEINENREKKTDSGSDTSSSDEDARPKKTTTRKQRKPTSDDDDEDDDDEEENGNALHVEEEDDFYDGDSALNIKSPVFTAQSSKKTLFSGRWGKKKSEDEMDGILANGDGALPKSVVSSKVSKKRKPSKSKSKKEKIANHNDSSDNDSGTFKLIKKRSLNTSSADNKKRSSNSSSLNADKKRGSNSVKRKSDLAAAAQTSSSSTTTTQRTSKTNASSKEFGSDQENDGLPSLALVSRIEKPWLELCHRALHDLHWSKDDCEKLIDEACILHKTLVIVQSGWLYHCREYVKQLKDKAKHVKFGVIIGHPHGHQCSAAKIAEIKYCLKQNVSQITVLFPCSIVMNRDWKHVQKEVTIIKKTVSKKCKLRFEYPKTDKVGQSTHNMFLETVSKIIDK